MIYDLYSFAEENKAVLVLAFTANVPRSLSTSLSSCKSIMSMLLIYLPAISHTQSSYIYYVVYSWFMAMGDTLGDMELYWQYLS